MGDEPAKKKEETKPQYRHADITTGEDYRIRGQLDRANDLNEAVSFLHVTMQS